MHRVTHVRLPYIHKNAAVFDFYFIGFQIHADGCRQGLTCADVKSPTVQWAFNHAVNDEPIGEALFFMRAHAIGGKKALFGVVNRVNVAVVLPSDQVFFIDIVGLPQKPRSSL